MNREDLRKSRYWEKKTLKEMSQQEWEALCDGCGRCCLQKIEYVDTNEIYFSKVACRMLDCQTAQCKDYTNRKQLVPDCIELQPSKVANYRFLPRTCAYRLIESGEPLYPWHPLESGSDLMEGKDTPSVTHFAISETKGMDPEDYLIEPPVLMD